jgi:hypothetical protein
MCIIRNDLSVQGIDAVSELVLGREHLEDAVNCGLITREQAAALSVLAQPPANPTDQPPRDDEHFQFLNGFNDIFLTIGVVFVSLSMLALGSSGGPLLGLIVAWAMSEVLVLQRRSVLPGIALAIFFSLFAAWCVQIIAGQSALNGWCVSGAAAALYYWRFKLPFALLIIAVSAAAALILLSVTRFYPDYAARFDKNFISNAIIIPALISGILTFSAAMYFDVSDPGRTSRRSDNGFWLHMAAAPLIVHPTIAPLFAASAEAPVSESQSLTVLGIVLILGVIALGIDRRALLVASLAYVLVAIGYLLKHGEHLGAGMPSWIGVPMLIVGAMVLILGLWWQPIRAMLLSPFQNSPILKMLPPLQT